MNKSVYEMVDEDVSRNCTIVDNGKYQLPPNLRTPYTNSEGSAQRLENISTCLRWDYVLQTKISQCTVNPFLCARSLDGVQIVNCITYNKIKKSAITDFVLDYRYVMETMRFGFAKCWQDS